MCMYRFAVYQTIARESSPHCDINTCTRKLYTHTCMHTHTHMHTHKHIYIHTQTHRHRHNLYIHIYTHACMHRQRQVDIRSHILISIRVSCYDQRQKRCLYANMIHSLQMQCLWLHQYINWWQCLYLAVIY